MRMLSEDSLLTIEDTEIGVYRYADAQGVGEWRVYDGPGMFATQVGESNEKLLMQLVVDLINRGHLAVEKFDPVSNRYLPYAYWNDVGKVFYMGETVRMRPTIAGRRRYETLLARREPSPKDRVIALIESRAAELKQQCEAKMSSIGLVGRDSETEEQAAIRRSAQSDFEISAELNRLIDQVQGN